MNHDPSTLRQARCPWPVLAFFWSTITLGAGCGQKPCDGNEDCVLLCQCESGADLSVGPYSCVAGRCESAYDRDADCAAPCERIASVPSAPSDDDSSR